MELLNVDTMAEAAKKLQDVTSDWHLKTEWVETSCSVGRILAEDVMAEEFVPDFDKSTVDGYAVNSKDTQGVTDSIPCFLDVTSEIHIGKEASVSIEPGQCAYVPTGGMLPKGADAVVMVEYAEIFDEQKVAIYDAVSPGRNVIRRGEDIEKGKIVLETGTRIRPQEAGTLAACGNARVRVFAKSKATILSTGDELLAIDAPSKPGCVRDINTHTIASACLENEIEVVSTKRLEDDEAVIREEIKAAMESSDLVVISGGSSQGKKDFTAKILDQISDVGVFTHGLALKPGKPTILAYDKRSTTLLVGLPGHPAAALMVFDLMILNLLRGKRKEKPPKSIPAFMENNIAGGDGRATCLFVKLVEEERGYVARPILGKSGLITTMSEADGYVIIESNKEGIKEGEMVQVIPT